MVKPKTGGKKKGRKPSKKAENEDLENNKVKIIIKILERVYLDRTTFNKICELICNRIHAYGVQQQCTQMCSWYFDSANKNLFVMRRFLQEIKFFIGLENRQLRRLSFAPICASPRASYFVNKQSLQKFSGERNSFSRISKFFF